MAGVVRGIEGEYRRYKALAEAAMAQVGDEALSRSASEDGNAIATIAWHVAGNLESRFTDFLTSDGEKPWRNRDAEFDPRTVSREALLARWEAGWRALLETLAALSDESLAGRVTVRGQPLGVDDALLRSLAHTAYHVGQIVFLAKQWQGASWACLSIPRGGSAAYNRSPDRERPAAHAQALGPQPAPEAQSIQPPPSTSSPS